MYPQVLKSLIILWLVLTIKNPDMQKEEESHYSDTQQGTNCLSGSKLSLFCAK